MEHYLEKYGFKGYLKSKIGPKVECMIVDKQIKIMEKRQKEMTEERNIYEVMINSLQKASSKAKDNIDNATMILELK